jgi:hypothetical protein
LRRLELQHFSNLAVEFRKLLFVVVPKRLLVVIIIFIFSFLLLFA